MLARLLVEWGTYQVEAALGAYRFWLASGHGPGVGGATQSP